MASTEPAASDALYKYVESLQLYAGSKKESLTWEESQSGPPHDSVFTTCAKIGNKVFPEAQGKTKKKAKHNAAKNACEELNLQYGTFELSFDSTSRTPSPAGMENHISKLNEYGQKKNLHIQYNFEQMNTGMAHIQKFTSHVTIGNKKYPEALGGSKQEAKREAARLAYEEIQESPSKNLEKSPMDVRSETDAKGTPEESSSQNPTRLTKDQMALNEDMSDLSMDSVIDRNIVDISSRTSFSGSKNVVGELNEFCQKNKLVHTFVQVDKRGPSHVPEFTVQCVINGKEFPSGTAKTKQEAKQRAAKHALEELENSSDVSRSQLNSVSQDGNLLKGGVRLSSMLVGSSSEPSTPSSMSITGSRSRRRLAPTWTGETASCQEGGQGENLRISMKEFTDLEQIGEGAFGCVYKAKYTLDERYYAIKEVPYENDNTKREVTSLATMDHPNIVRYHTSWCEESHSKGNKKSLFIQMKLYKTTLKDWIEDSRHNQPQQKEICLDIMRQLLDGVDYIHQKSMIHRDLKPANIFLAEEAKLEAKIGDFGLVRVNSQKPLTRNVGTPGYMSPEQWKEEPYNHKVDIFALGLIFFELLWTRHGTATEKAMKWKSIRKGMFPGDFAEEHSLESLLIRKMLSEVADERPEAAQVRRNLDSSDPQTI